MAQEDFTTARIVNIVLGVWLFISAFLWPHTYAQMTNTWILGVLCVVFALVAMRVPVLARFDRDVPDALADDLVGVQALRAAGTAPAPSPKSPSLSPKTEAMT